MSRTATASCSFFRRTCGFACVLAVLALIFAYPAAAESAEVVRVGYYENEVFQEGAQPGAIKTGYAYEYYLKLSEYTGWQYEYIYGGYSELYQMLLDGKIDLLAGLAKKEERIGLIGYPYAAMGNESYNLVRHISDDRITVDPSTLNGMRIGVLNSAMVDVLNRYLEEHRITAEVIPYEDHETMFNAFDSGRLDILAAEGDGAYGRDQAEVLFSFGASDYYLCVNIHRPDLLEELNTAQSTLAAEEPYYLYSLSTRYYPVSLSARAFSASEKAWLNTHDTMRVGYLENYLPYSGTDSQGNVTGIVSDMVPKILNELGISHISVSYTGYKNYDAMIADMESGSIDLAFPVGGGLYFSEENGIYQSTPVVSSSTELIYKGDYTEDTTGMIAINDNNRMQYYYVRTYFPDANITLYPSIDDCLNAVLDGKAGSTTLNGLRANDILKNTRYKSLSFRQLARNDDRCFGVKIGNEGLLKLLNRGVNVVGTDYAQSISHRYTDGLYSYTLMDTIRDNMALFGALILAIAAFIIFLLVRDKKRSAAALSAAERANRAKTVFLNNMSHDIRTPMNAIIGFTELASSHAEDPKRVREDLGRISVASRHLLSLINDVLDMSRIESGNVPLEEAPVHLPDVIRGLETIIRPGAEEKNLQLIVRMYDVIHEDIITDRLRLNQVLLNILSNAVKFTPAGGTVVFSTAEIPGATPGTADYEFRIRDNGIGMSEEFQKTVFDAFSREKTSTVSGIEGAGLGMAISKNLVDMMGGTITVTSALGKGSEFVVTLPCRFSMETVREETEEKAPAFTGKAVLLAEDNEMNQLIATEILEHAGLTVVIAANGQEAVDKVSCSPAGSYDIILMDIQMPVMDGFEAARKIRALDDPEKAGIPIVAVTANAFEEDRKAALEAGMNGHLAKPYDIPKIMETLQELIGPKP